MRSEDFDAVRALPLFSTMEKATFDKMMPASFLQRFPAGVELIREGETADFLYIVVDGSVELFATGNGRETTVAVFQPVTAFILAAVVKDMIYLMSARTLQDSRILMIPAELLRQAMDKDPAFAKAMIDELARGFRTMVRAVKNQKLRTGAERLANYLLLQDSQQEGHGLVRLAYEKRLLASLLGITPENLSRAFRTLGPYGVIVEGSTIRITDKAALSRFAKPSPLIDDPEN